MTRLYHSARAVRMVPSCMGLEEVSVSMGRVWRIITSAQIFSHSVRTARAFPGDGVVTGVRRLRFRSAKLTT